MKGSMTIEASYIFPFCFIVIGIVCFLGIFQYNQAILKMTGYECILQRIDEGEGNEEVLEENLLRSAKQAAEDRTFGLKDLKTSAKITASKISLTYHAVQSMLDIPLEVTVVYERIYPELTLRLTAGKQEI